MFLDRLEGEEKKYFLDLSICTAKTNGVVEATEKAIINQYCREMAIDYSIDDVESVDEAVDFFSKSDSWKKNIVIVELIGLGCVDGEFDKTERDYVESIAEKIGLGREKVDILSVDVKEYKKLVKEMCEHLFT